MRIAEIQYESCTQFFSLLEYDCPPIIIFGPLFQKVLKLILYVRYGKKVLRTFDVDAKGEFSENFFQPTTSSDAA
jgi:hypothetical protein